MFAKYYGNIFSQKSKLLYQMMCKMTRFKLASETNV